MQNKVDILEFVFQGNDPQFAFFKNVVLEKVPKAGLKLLSQDGDNYNCTMPADPESLFLVGMIVSACYNEFGHLLNTEFEQEHRLKPLTDNSQIACVDAVHIDEDGETSYRYTWAVSSSIEINIGDTLVVEQRVGNKLAFVRAVSAVYMKTTKQHEVDIHPYCAVITNIGHKL